MAKDPEDDAFTWWQRVGASRCPETDYAGHEHARFKKVNQVALEWQSKLPVLDEEIAAIQAEEIEEAPKRWDDTSCRISKTRMIPRNHGLLRNPKKEQAVVDRNLSQQRSSNGMPQDQHGSRNCNSRRSGLRAPA